MGNESVSDSTYQKALLQNSEEVETLEEETETPSIAIALKGEWTFREAYVPITRHSTPALKYMERNSRDTE